MRAGMQPSNCPHRVMLIARRPPLPLLSIMLDPEMAGSPRRMRGRIMSALRRMDLELEQEEVEAGAAYLASYKGRVQVHRRMVRELGDGRERLQQHAARYSRCLEAVERALQD